ncbi:MAG TPA: GGDEF domain-containing protein, partial [Steroidobacteraceae bacterium]|nr:GGDEF domain-containing protein [Steroidobacteraceae bacterium]
MPGTRRAGTFARLLLPVILLTACRLAHAACIASPDPAIRDLQALAVANPNQALMRTEAMLRVAAARNAPALDVAWLHSVRAHAYSALELDADARAAAAAGMKLVPDVREPVRLALLFTDSENIYDAEGIAEAKRTVESVRAAGVASAEAERCLLLTLGILQFRENRADLAVVTLTQAYRASAAAGNIEQRTLAASNLSTVMRELGDYRQALALNSEVIEWNVAHDETLQLSVSRYLRGIILHEMREYDASMLAFANARALSVTIGDEQGVAFADMRVCDVLIDLGDFRGARNRCEDALKIFAASGTVDVVKQTRSFLAQIDLAEGHAARALATLNEILANGASDMPPREVTPLFKLRADANAALGNIPAAYADLDEYMRRYTTTNETRRVRQVAALHARFEIDRQLDRNAALQIELAQSKERQAELQRRTWLAISAGALVITLLTALLVGARLHRLQLAKLANLDALTGLPNRRHAAHLASAALEQAMRDPVPLTLALIDLDHFKVINDRCGHAGGDQVLKEFARLSRDVLRGTDILGRWGGEEF